MENSTKFSCPVCGHSTVRALSFVKEEKLTQCLSCLFVGLDPFDKKYDASVFHEYYDVFGDIDLWTKSRENLFRHFLCEIGKRVEGRKLFDAGAGIGYFLYLAKEHGWEGMGVDLSEKACRTASRLYNVSVTQQPVTAFPKEKGPFDAVVFLDSLYYSRDPYQELKVVHALLREGGIVALRVTNVYFHLWAYRIFYGFKPLWHLLGVKKIFVFHFCLFSPRTIRILLQRCGYRDITVRNSPLTTGDPYQLIRGLGHAGLWLKSFIFFMIRIISYGTGGSVLLGPSLEVYARRR